MSIIKNAAASFVVSAASVIGMCVGVSMWAGGLGDFVEEKTKKLLSKKDEEEL